MISSPSSCTIDHFRRNVYRPRLCLLLLILILSPHNASELSGQINTQNHSPSTDWAVSVIDGMIVAASVAPPNTPVVIPPSTPPQKGTTLNDSVITSTTQCSSAPLTAPTPPTVSSKRQVLTGHDSNSQPAPGSLFKLPKLSWGLLIDSHVLPAILTLHALWALRFVGMAVEDGIVKTSLIGSKSRLYSFVFPLLQLVFLTFLASFIGSPWLLDRLKQWCDPWRVSFNIHDTSSDAESTQVLLPLKAIVLLETLTVVVSLWSAVFKMDDEALSFLPKTIRLPSPSHSPSIIELLPLPPTLISVLTGGRPPARHRQTAVARDVESRHQDTAQARTTALEEPAQEAEQRQQTFRTVGGGDAGVVHSTSVSQPLAPLHLPNSDPVAVAHRHYLSTRRRSKALRIRGQRVSVSTKWFADSVVSLFDRVIGSLIYAIVTLHLPTLSPTSLPPVLSLLSLRSELSYLTSNWSRARGSVECLEFVRRRWGIDLTPYQPAYNNRDYKWTSHDDVYCSICFELTRPKQREEKKTYQFCRLDCGHEMHDTCLVSWLTAQAFCPTCHCVLSFSPPPST